MNRESLKRHCEVMCKNYKDVPTSGTYGEHRLVLDLLEQTEWIPVCERLPKKSGYYLVSTMDCITIMEFVGGWISQNLGLCNWYVKAWMPLPKQYKAESEE